MHLTVFLLHIKYIFPEWISQHVYCLHLNKNQHIPWLYLLTLYIIILYTQALQKESELLANLTHTANMKKSTYHHTPATKEKIYWFIYWRLMTHQPHRVTTELFTSLNLTQVEYNTKIYTSYKRKTYKHNPKVSPFGNIALAKNDK